MAVNVLVPLLIPLGEQLTNVTQLIGGGSGAVAFPQDVYHVSVRENAKAASLIDLTPNVTLPGAVMECKIKEGNQDGAFHLDPLTGILSLISPLDFEQAQRHVLVVACRVGGVGVGQVRVVVGVEDENDHAPTFPRTRHETQITEEDDRHLPKTIITVTAKDGDAGQWGQLSYSISGDGITHDNTSAFDVHATTGDVLILRPLDRDPPHGHPRWRLRVRATDGELDAFTDVVVNLKDVNDNAPVFPNPTLHAAISEDTPKGALVVKAEAVDNDDPREGTNAHLTYSLEKNVVDESSGSPILVIDSHSGLITTALCCLDREKTQRYVVQVVATDGGGLKGTGTVLVEVEDVNDVPPRFSRPEWSLSVPERQSPHRVLATLTVLDQDITNDFSFRIVPGSGHGWQLFRVEGRGVGVAGGDLRPIEPLDYENPDHRRGFRFRVQVTDMGELGWSDKYHVDGTWVNLHVVDENDNPPTFTTHTHAHHTLPEDAHTPTVLSSFTAADLDGGGDVVSYTIDPESDPGGLFSVDATGTVRLAGRLDRETAEVHTVLVWATDHGDPPKTATATLTVNVTDVNDNPPFLGSPREVWVEENSDPGEVGRVRLDDPDDWGQGYGPPFSISLDPDAPPDVANIISVTLDPDGDGGRGVGVVATVGGLDREETKCVLVPLVVADNASLSATVTFTIHVSDLNDNPMTPAARTLTVYTLKNPKHEEVVPLGQMVPLGQVYVNDLDEEDDAGKIYTWKHPHPGFYLNASSGHLSMDANTLDGRYALQFLVSDPSLNQMDVAANVTVEVKQVTSHEVTHAGHLTLEGDPYEIIRQGYQGKSSVLERLMTTTKAFLSNGSGEVMAWIDEAAEDGEVNSDGDKMVMVDEDGTESQSVVPELKQQPRWTRVWLAAPGVYNLNTVLLYRRFQLSEAMGVGVRSVGVPQCGRATRSCKGGCWARVEAGGGFVMVDAKESGVVGPRVVVRRGCGCQSPHSVHQNPPSPLHLKVRPSVQRTPYYGNQNSPFIHHENKPSVLRAPQSIHQNPQSLNHHDTQPSIKQTPLSVAHIPPSPLHYQTPHPLSHQTPQSTSQSPFSIHHERHPPVLQVPHSPVHYQTPPSIHQTPTTTAFHQTPQNIHQTPLPLDQIPPPVLRPFHQMPSLSIHGSSLSVYHQTQASVQNSPSPVYQTPSSIYHQSLSSVLQKPPTAIHQHTPSVHQQFPPSFHRSPQSASHQTQLPMHQVSPTSLHQAPPLPHQILPPPVPLHQSTPHLIPSSPASLHQTPPQPHQSPPPLHHHTPSTPSHRHHTCLPNTCLNGGRCIPTSTGTRCICPYGTWGSRCKVLSRHFEGGEGRGADPEGGWAWLPPLPACPEVHLSLEILTVDQDSLLLYSGPDQVKSSRHIVNTAAEDAPSELVIFELRGGRPYLQLDFGDGEIALDLTSSYTLADNTWHRIDVVWKDELVEMIVDLCSGVGVDAVLSQNTSTFTPPDAHTCRVAARLPTAAHIISNAHPLQIGGLASLPSSKDNKASKASGSSQNFTPFRGCIRNLRINRELVDLGVGVLSSGSSPGCPSTDCLLGGLRCGLHAECYGPPGALRCECGLGWTGPPSCTTPTTPTTLKAKSVISISLSFTPVPYTTVLSLRFRTRKDGGQLISLASNWGRDHLALQLMSGRLCVRLQLHPDPAKCLCLTQALLTDGQWHAVSVVRHGSATFLAVDDGDSDLYNSSIGLEGLGLLQVDPRQGVQLGGKVVLQEGRVSSQHCFEGCLDDVRIGGRRVPLPPTRNVSEWGEAVEWKGVDEGCVAPSLCTNTTTINATNTCTPPLSCQDTWRSYTCSCGEGRVFDSERRACQDEDLCLFSPCLNGASCITTQQGGGYVCVCPVGFSGPNCRLPDLGDTSLKMSLGALLVMLVWCVFVLLLVCAFLFHHHHKRSGVRRSGGTSGGQSGVGKGGPPPPPSPTPHPPNLIHLHPIHPATPNGQAHSVNQNIADVDLLQMDAASVYSSSEGFHHCCTTRHQQQQQQRTARQQGEEAEGSTNSCCGDDFRNYCYEGEGSTAGSLSSCLESCSGSSKFLGGFREVAQLLDS